MTRKSGPIIAVLLVSLLVWLSRQYHQVGIPVDVGTPGQGNISVYFSPHGGCRDAVIQQIDSARASIEFQAYTFTSYEIAQALVAAHDRGVKVTAVLDEKQRTAMLATIPLGRAGTDVEIAASVAFLASEGAGYITGHVLDVNGGMFIG